jgi:hypothetical protein
MSAEVASAFVTLVPSFTGGQAAISRELDGPMTRAGSVSGRKAGTGISKGIGGVVAGAATKIFAPLAAAAAGVSLFGFLKDSVDEASGLAEAGNKVNAIFGTKGAKAVEAFSKSASKGLGQSKLQAINASSTFGVFGKAAGLAGTDLAKFSTDFTGLASDMASFYDSSPEEAIDAIGSALRGEAEPIRKYGVLLDDASLRQEALKQGLIKTTKQALTPQQKVLAAQALIYKQTKDAQGDFSKTSGSLANQQRILSASFTDIKAKVGQALLPTLNRLAGWFIKEGLPAIQRFGGWLKEDLWPALKKGYETIMPGVQEALDIIGGAFDGNGGSAKGFAKVITETIIPAVSTFARVYLPQMARQLRIAIEAVKLVWKAFETWRTVMGSVVSFVLGAFASLARGFATLLRGLSRVPGFGWAKGAADKMDKAAGVADRLKRNIDNIDRKVKIDVDIYARTRQTGRITLPDGSKVNVGMREHGGPVTKGHPYVVGEKRPELFVPKTDGYIVPRVPDFDGGAASKSGVQQTNHFHGITDPEEAAAAATARLTFAMRLP